MCIHTVLLHTCGHLVWCPNVLEKCESVLEDLSAHGKQPQGTITPGETAWPTPMPRPCKILWPVIHDPNYNIYAGLRPTYVRAEGLLEPLPQDVDPAIHVAVELPWTIHYQPYPFVYGCWSDQVGPAYGTNTIVRWVPFGCGCGGSPDTTSEQLTPVERQMAMAYEFGLMTTYEDMPWPLSGGNNESPRGGRGGNSGHADRDNERISRRQALRKSQNDRRHRGRRAANPPRDSPTQPAPWSQNWRQDRDPDVEQYSREQCLGKSED